MRPFVRAIVERDGKFLVLKEDRPDGRWNFPGGKIETQDWLLDDATRSPASYAVMRELVEQVGLLVVERPELYHTEHFCIDDVNWVGYYYLVETIGEATIREPDKCLEMRWVTREEFGLLPRLEKSLTI